jgi:hypothetical protein
MERGAVSRRLMKRSLGLVLASIGIQCVLGLLFGHYDDQAIFLATGYLVGTGQNPYLAQDLSGVFNSDYFRSLTTIGYPPPWPLFLGCAYRCTYALVPNLLVYNLVTKLPIIAANVCLSFLTYDILCKLHAGSTVARKAGLFLLFNPFLLYASAAWGQFDSIVALFSLWSLYLLSGKKEGWAALLLALAISLKPIALPLVPVVFAWFIGRSAIRALRFTAIFCAAMVLFCIIPFFIFQWNPSVILRHWNVHFLMVGCMSYMTTMPFFMKIVSGSMGPAAQSPFLGVLWVPCLAIATLFLRHGIEDFADLLKKGVAFVLIFYLTRTWVSEQNIILLIPPVLVLSSLGKLDRFSITALWVLPIAFTLFNETVALLCFPSMPRVMERLLSFANEFPRVGIAARSFVVILWLIAGWWIAAACLKNRLSPQVSTILD